LLQRHWVPGLNNEDLLPVDHLLLQWINLTATHPVLDWLMAIASSLALWFWPAVICALWFLWRGPLRSRLFVVVALVGVGLSDGVVGNTLKRIANRPRPDEVLVGVRRVDLGKSVWRGLVEGPGIRFPRPRLKSEPGRSFPSNHTLNTTMLAVVALAFFGRNARWILLVPLLVGYSRIYTGSHWPSDVALSWFLGAGVAVLYLEAVAAVWKCWGAKRFPLERPLLCWFDSEPAPVSGDR
jgi:undecaprenyl-diphosphatase